MGSQQPGQKSAVACQGGCWWLLLSPAQWLRANLSGGRILAELALVLDCSWGPADPVQPQAGSGAGLSSSKILEIATMVWPDPASAPQHSPLSAQQPTGAGGTQAYSRDCPAWALLPLCWPEKKERFPRIFHFIHGCSQRCISFLFASLPWVPLMQNHYKEEEGAWRIFRVLFTGLFPVVERPYLVTANNEKETSSLQTLQIRIIFHSHLEEKSRNTKQIFSGEPPSTWRESELELSLPHSGIIPSLVVPSLVSHCFHPLLPY